MEVKTIINAWIKEGLRSASHVPHLVVMGIFGLNYRTLWMMVGDAPSLAVITVLIHPKNRLRVRLKILW